MEKNKKLLLYFLALNSVLTSYSAADTSQQVKYDNLYKSMTKNLETGKSNYHLNISKKLIGAGLK